MLRGGGHVGLSSGEAIQVTVHVYIVYSTCITGFVFSDCCEEMAGPLTNDTLDDLLSSMDDEETATELENNVCPVGFSHNAEMNVCDDLNEVSRLKNIFIIKIITFFSSVKKRIFFNATSDLLV